MGAIQTRPSVRSFQSGGMQSADEPSMLFPGQPPQAAPAPLPTPAPAPQPAPVQAQPAPALQTSPFLNSTEPQPSTDETDLAGAKAEDQQAMQREVSHLGDNNFLTPKPARGSPVDDPEYQRAVEAEKILRDAVAAGQIPKPADYARMSRMIKGQKDNVTKRLEKEYTTQLQDWRRQESQQLQGAHGDKLVGTSLEQAQALVDEHRQAVTAKYADNPYAQAIGAHNPKIMDPEDFTETALRIHQLNNQPSSQATSTLLRLASPVGAGQKAFNDRRGIAAASYKIVGRDVANNYVLQTEKGPVRVPKAQFEKIEEARHRAYKAGVAFAKKTPDRTRTFGEFVADQFK